MTGLPPDGEPDAPPGRAAPDAPGHRTRHPPPRSRRRPIGVLGTPSRRDRRGHRPRRRGRLLLVLGLLALPFVVAAAWFWYQLDPIGEPGRPVAVTIPKGEGVSGIGDRLARQDVIGSSLAFSVYARLSGSERFQAGRYSMRQDLGVRGAIDVLERGPSQHYTTLALPPGLTFGEIAARIGALPGRSADRATELATTGQVRSRFEPVGTNSLEGLTWPDSYSVEDHESEADILRTIVRAFDRHATALGLRRAPDPYRTVIVASLIQREAGDRRGPSAHRRGDREPTPRRHAPADRRHRRVRARAAGPDRSPTPTSPATRRTTPTACAGCRPPRSRRCRAHR